MEEKGVSTVSVRASVDAVGNHDSRTTTFGRFKRQDLMLLRPLDVGHDDTVVMITTS